MTAWNAVFLLLATLAVLAASSPLPPGRSLPRPSRALFERSERPMGMADPTRPRVHAPRRARPAGPSSRADEGSYRLPTALRPYYYKIILTPQLSGNFEFEGFMEVYLNALETVNKIVLHSKEISFSVDSVVVYEERDGVLYSWAFPTDIAFDEASETVTVNIGRALRPGGHYVLRINKFTGKLNDDMDGFYRSSYTTSTGETKWLATTQFETTGARRAFPCWDEPEYKARFDIVIKHPNTYSAVSNLPLVQSKSDSNRMVEDTFMSTLPMSTYLVAFIVSDFAAVTNRGANFTTWARPDLISGATLAQDIGNAALRALSDFNGVDYSLPKMDQAAIPDFAAGAMENWGLVTYREEALIEMPHASMRSREGIAITICHELGHQWSGNLVTMDWWEHLWLNEGFATFYQSIICDQIRPDWNLEDKMVSGDYHAAMEGDARETQVAMSAPANSYEEIEDRFSVISYSKGGSVLRMFYHALTPEVFKKGVRRYLSNNWFKNVNPGHLFKAFNAEIEISDQHQIPRGVSFAEVASTWTEQPGVPVLSATRDYTSGQIRFTQKRFLYVPASDESLVSQKWYIPLVVTSQAKPDFDTTLPQGWLVPSATSVSMPTGAKADQWVLVNPKATGYFRVNYDETNWKLLAAALASSPSTIHPASRAQLLNDALELARGGQLEYSLALPFLQALKQERSVAVWQAAISATNYLRTRLDITEASDALQSLIKDVTASAFDELGYTFPDSEEHDKSYLRYYIASEACLAGNSKCLTAAASALKAWLASPSSSPLQPDTRGTSLCFGVRGSDATTFEAMRQLWLAETNADTRVEYVYALACSRDRKLLTGLMEDALALKYKRADAIDVFKAVYQYTWNHAVLLDFTKENADAIRTTFGKFNTDMLLISLILDVSTRTELSEVRAWVEAKYQSQDSWEVLQLALAAVETELESWFDKYYAGVSTWLESAAAATTATTGGSTNSPTTPGTETSTKGGVSTPSLSGVVLLLAVLCSVSFA